MHNPRNGDGAHQACSYGSAEVSTPSISNTLLRWRPKQYHVSVNKHMLKTSKKAKSIQRVTGKACLPMCLPTASQILIFPSAQPVNSSPASLKQTLDIADACPLKDLGSLYICTAAETREAAGLDRALNISGACAGVTLELLLHDQNWIMEPCQPAAIEPFEEDMSTHRKAPRLASDRLKHSCANTCGTQAVTGAHCKANNAERVCKLCTTWWSHSYKRKPYCSIAQLQVGY